MCSADDLALSIYRHASVSGFLLYEAVCDVFLSHFAPCAVEKAFVKKMKVIDSFEVDGEHYEVRFDQAQEDPTYYILGPSGEVYRENDPPENLDVDECARVLRLVSCNNELCEGKVCRVFFSCKQLVAQEIALEG